MSMRASTANEYESRAFTQKETAMSQLFLQVAEQHSCCTFLCGSLDKQWTINACLTLGGNNGETVKCFSPTVLMMCYDELEKIK